MAELGKQFLDTDGLNALWTKHKKVQPFYQEIGTSGTNGWVNFLTVKATTYMNHPLVVRLLCQGYSDSTMDVQFASANNTAPTIQYFKQRIQPYSGTHAIPKPGYTYEDVDGVRYYKFWLKKNEASGSIGVHVESEYFYTTGAEDTGILTFPNVQSDTEPSGIVYVAAADIVYEAVPAKTAVSAAAVKVGTNAIGQVVLGNALTKTDVGLGNVDNTSDANKPISTATQKALDGKVSKAGDTMTGPLVNTSNTANAIKVSHGAANTNAAVLAERTDTGVSVFMGVGATGSNHGVYSNKNANWIIRADGSGNVFVNDTKATSTVHIGNSDVGSTTKPVYIDDGVIKAGSTYAGGTAVTLNGTSASGSTASFYAPTDTGTNHRLLRSNGSGAPTWQIPAADYAFSGPSWNTGGDTHTFWAFRLKGITAYSYNNVLLSIDSYFWNNQKSTSDLIWIGWSNNGNQNLVATAGRVRIAGNDNSDAPLEYYLVKNKADTAADCTVDLYIRSSFIGNSYGPFYVNVLNSGNRDLDTIIEQKGTYNVDLPEGAIKIPYAGTIGSAGRLSTKRELAVGLGNTSTTTKFDGSADVTNIRVTGTLPVANGGTGATTPAGAQFNLIDKATTELSPMEDKHRIAIMSPEPSATNSVIAGYRTGLTMWNYMKGKMSSDTGVNISGNAATATSAGKLTTGRELAVGLSNTSTTTTFDGSANVTNIKVSGQLPVANGGTGSNTAAGARTNLSVYSKSEIDSLMSGRVEIVTELPATGKSGITYYVGPTGSGADKYDEYIWTGSAFLKVGEHSLDLSNYVNTVATSGSGSVVTGVSKSGNTVTVTKGNISLDDLSDWATETDVTISNVTYHTMWPVAPTSSNQVYGISINNGRLFRIYNNKGAYSVQAYDKDSDTTYTPQKLGIGYGTCTTAEATAAKVATLADYTLVKNGIVAVKFSYPLCASATLNINGKGAKPVYVGGAAVTATNCKSVQAGDIGYFIYDGTAYHFLGTDRAGKSAITGLSVSGKTVTYTRSDGETGTFDTQDTTYSFADGYNASTNKGATVATVTNAINALDVSDISGFGAGKTLATLKEENGKISATFQDISITKSQVSDFSHTHGNIQNGGTLQTNDITIANGDKLVVTDASDSNKVARASLTFDGATTNQMLSKKGEWSDTIAKARAVVDYGSPSKAIEIGWGGASVTSTRHFAVYTDSANGYNKAIKDCPLANVKKLINGTSVGSAAVPVFINADGETQVCTDDFVHDGDVTSTYSSTGTAPVNGTAVAAAIGGLDVSSVGGDGKYISAISETDGKISAAATTMDTTPTANSTKAVTSGGIKTALNDKFDKYGFFGNTDGKWIGAALSVVGETEVKYWKLCSFTTRDYWTLNFVADVTNAQFDSNVFERKIIAIYGSTPGVVYSALEIREGNNKLYSTRGYGNIIYYETSGNNVTIYIKARFAANVGQYCRLVSVLSVSSISNLTWYQETTAGTQPENPVKFSLGYKTVKPAGSTSVPVYIGSDGNPTACTDDFVHDGDVTSTYSSTGTAPVNGTAVAAAIGGLDVSNITGFGAGKTLAALTETDGKISATFQDISITKSQVSDFSHTHGNIANGGTLQTNDITIANGDKLVVTDSSDSSKVARASISFDGSTTTQALTKAGTWATFNNYSLPLAASGTRGGIQIGYSESGTNYAVKLSSEKAYVTVPWTDTKQNITLATTTKAFITGVSTTPTSTAQALAGLADTGVYLTTTAGELNATQYKVNEHCTMKYNSTKSSLDFTFS